MSVRDAHALTRALFKYLSAAGTASQLGDVAIYLDIARCGEYTVGRLNETAGYCCGTLIKKQFFTGKKYEEKSRGGWREEWDAEDMGFAACVQISSARGEPAQPAVLMLILK